MKTKHTPGPWNVADYSEDRSELAVTISDKTVALLTQEMYDNQIPQDEVEANAHLIAAAPDMLEALEFARTFIENSMCLVTNEYERMANIQAFGVVENAIRKARGE